MLLFKQEEKTEIQKFFWSV